MLQRFLRARERKRLNNPESDVLYQEHADEIVSIDCETTSLDVKEAEIISIGAVKIRGNTILTSESFYVIVKPEGMLQAANVTVHGLRPKDLSNGIPVQDAIRQLLAFVGGRPLLGYYLEYDVAMINKFLQPMLGIKLPQKQIEVSSLYARQEAKYNYYDNYVDLRMASIIKKLKVPDLPRHDALNDAINVAVMYLTLQAKMRR